MKICEAYCDENGGARGGQLGDQTGRELRIRDWYERSGGWDCCLVPTSEYYARKAADLAVRIQKSRRCGYDRDKRLYLYKALKKASWVPEQMEPCACDCSSLVCACYIGAGLADLNPSGTTKNLEKLLMETGYFVKRAGRAEFGILGAVYVAAGAHTLIVVEGATEEPEKEDGKHYVKTVGSVRIREKPVTGKKVRTATNEVLEVLGQDAESGWYQVADGWISSNKRYVKDV